MTDEQADNAAANLRKMVEAVWLEGAREMYLDIQKVFPLTAPADVYARQLLEKINGERP